MKKFLHHLFLPKETNNYRPKLLHHKILLALIIFFVSAGIVSSVVKTNYPQVLGISADISSQDLLLKTNEKRLEAGLPALTLDNELSQAAINKATDMFGKDYWAHVAPDGTTPWVFIQQSGYKYIYAGENLARGYYSASDVINAWMASPEHKENMLSPNYKNVGFAVSTGKLSGEDTVLIVEMLGSTNIAVAPPASEPTAEVVATAQTDSDSLANATPQQAPSITPVQSETLAARKVKTDLNSKDSVVSSAVKSKVLINSQTFAFDSAKMFVALFIFILLLDMILIERRKIIRFVGHNLDHIFFLSLILLAILILAKGGVV